MFDKKKILPMLGIFALVYDGRQWENVLGSPLGWNIEREGILL